MTWSLAPGLISASRCGSSAGRRSYHMAFALVTIEEEAVRRSDDVIFMCAVEIT
jgi:hypothetical protein